MKMRWLQATIMLIVAMLLFSGLQLFQFENSIAASIAGPVQAEYSNAPVQPMSTTTLLANGGFSEGVSGQWTSDPPTDKHDIPTDWPWGSYSGAYSGSDYYPMTNVEYVGGTHGYAFLIDTPYLGSTQTSIAFHSSDISIPLDISSFNLQFDLSKESGDYVKFHVDLFDMVEGGYISQTFTVYPSSGWTTKTLYPSSVSDVAGKTVEVAFCQYTDSGNADNTWLFVDNFRVNYNINPTVSSPTPSDGATGITLSPTLSWSGTDPDSSSLNYDIYFGTDSNPGLAASGLNSPSYSLGSLTQSTTYYWKVVAKDSDGGIKEGPIWSFTTNKPPIPAYAPTPSDGASDIKISPTLYWSCSDPDGDNLLYSVHLGTTNPPPEVYTTYSTSYNPGSLSPGTTYFWYISASDGKQGLSKSSTWQFRTTQNPVLSNPFPPDGASDVSVTVTLLWSCSDPDGDNLVYNVYFGTSSDPPLVRSTYSTSYSPGPLEKNLVYYWRIVVNDDKGASASSPLWHFTTEPAVPSAPLDLQATAGNKQVSLVWNPPADNGGASITEYRIYRRTGDSESFINRVSITSYTDNNLINNKTYSYCVSAVNSAGEGGKSASVSATPLGVPTPPLNLMATAGNTQISLMWDKPTDDGGSPITGYNIYRRTSDGTEEFYATTGKNSYTDTGLPNGESCFYRVSAVNNIGEGLKSAEVSATTLDVPSVPLGLQASPSDGQITLDWSPPLSDGGAPITNYAIYRGTSSDSEEVIDVIGNVLTYTDRGVNNGQAYHYRVSAINTVGEGAKSAEVTGVPTQVSTPSAPVNLSATVSDGHIILKWSPPSSDGGSYIEHYKIYRGTSAGGEDESPIATIGNLSTYTDTNLTLGFSYYYRVRAVNAIGEGAFSIEVSADLSSSSMAESEYQRHWLNLTINTSNVLVGYDGNGSVSVVEVGDPNEMGPEQMSAVGIFFRIQTNGSVDNVTIVISYDDSQLSDVDESLLNLYELKDGLWTPLPYESSDIMSNRLSAQTDSDSGTYGVFKVSDAAKTNSEPVSESLPSFTYNSLTAFLILVLVAATVLIRHERGCFWTWTYFREIRPKLKRYAKDISDTGAKEELQRIASRKKSCTRIINQKLIDIENRN